MLQTAICWGREDASLRHRCLPTSYRRTGYGIGGPVPRGCGKYVILEKRGTVGDGVIGYALSVNGSENVV